MLGSSEIALGGRFHADEMPLPHFATPNYSTVSLFPSALTFWGEWLEQEGWKRLSVGAGKQCLPTQECRVQTNITL